MSAALDKLDTIIAQNHRIITLLEAKTGVQLEHTGVIRDGNRTFIPGTGWTGQQSPIEDDGTTATPADARRSLEKARADCVRPESAKETP